MMRWPWHSRRRSTRDDEVSLESALLTPQLQEPAPRKVFPSGIKLLYDGDSNAVDIVFVHGLTGDREKTWRSKDAASPWPQALLPSRIPAARILTFGYDAYVTDWRGMVSKNRIGNHSMNMLSAIAAYREGDDTNDRPIIFVCHSLGGLVCEDALTMAQQRPERHIKQILHSTRGIVFLGTPHHGSGLAHWAKSLARALGLLKQTNPEILAVLKSDSEVLERIQNGFHTMIRSRAQDRLPLIEITCFYEELPLPGVGTVVPSHSGILPGYIPIGIRSNHMDMTKFENEDDPGFIAVVGELRRWVKEITKAEIARSRQLGAEESYTHAGCDGAEGDQVLRIHQDGSEFRGSTTVNGGMLFQGNCVGR
ncbi:Protein SERAC1, partial [Tolypocladium ophioglossoides CBS 100239]